MKARTQRRLNGVSHAIWSASDGRHATLRHQRCWKNPRVTLCLAAGKIANATSRKALQDHFDSVGWKLFDDQLIHVAGSAPMPEERTRPPRARHLA